MRTAPVLALLLLGATASAAEPPSREVALFAPDAVQAAFAQGMPLVESDAFKVHASRRESAGQAEVHVRDTDVIYVLEGVATLVTGGNVVGGKEVAPGEIRGASIEGGVERALAPGAVVIVPNGVPHWFRAVTPPVLYYVVKVTAPGAVR